MIKKTKVWAVVRNWQTCIENHKLKMKKKLYIIDDIEREKIYNVYKSGSSGQKLVKNVGHRRITVLCLSPNLCHEKKKKRHKGIDFGESNSK